MLAVVLGLFAHQGALAQTQGSALSGLTVTVSEGTGTVDPLDPAFASGTDTRTFTTEVPFGVTQVTVDADEQSGWEVAYQGAADADGNAADYQRDLRLGTNTITVRATKTADPPETARNYTITVRRLAETGSALSALSLSAGTLDPEFDATTDDRTFTADDVALSVTTLTVTATAKPGWEDLTFHDDPDADSGTAGYQRNLAVGANRITVRATPTGASGTRNYTITVTRTTTPSEPRNLRAASADRGVRLTWTAPSSDGGMDIVGYDFRSKDADEDDGQWMDDDTWNPISGSDDSTTSHDVDSLINGTTYIFQVRARNANSNTNPNTDPQGSASNTAEATPARPLPAPVWTTTDPPSVVAGNRRVTLSWTRIPDATNSDVEDESVSGYQYRRRVGTGGWGGWTTIADRDLVESGTTRSYTVTGLTNDTTYRFQVRGRSSVGGGAASTEREATPMADAPGAPTNLRPTAGDGQVTLSWTAPSDNGGEPITGYEYKYRPRTNGNANDWIATGGTQTTVTVYGLVNGTTYYFTVRAVNDLGCTATATEMDGCGDESLEVSATPFGKPDTRVTLDLAESGDRRVELTWSIQNVSPPPADDRSGFQYRQNGSWFDIPNSDASTDTHVVGDLTNGTTYTFQVRAVNSSGGGDASNERSAVPATTPGSPTLTATAGDEEVSLSWTTPADDGGRRISSYECQLTTGTEAYRNVPSPRCAGKSLGASATSLTLTDDDTPSIANGTTYRFQVRAVNAIGKGDWSKEASARPTDTPGAPSFTISATIDGESWAKAISGSGSYPLRATVEVNPRLTAQRTSLTVTATGAGIGDESETVMFGPTDSRRDASFDVTPRTAGYITIALFRPENDSALAVTRVEIRSGDTPDPPTGLVATRGDGEVTLSWATLDNQSGYDWDYRQRRQSGSYGRWTDFARDELVNDAVTSNMVTGLTNGGTYAFQVRAVAVDNNGNRIADAESGPSDEVSVSLSGTVETGALSAPRNFAAAAGDRQVTLSWTAPAADGGAAISGYQYQLRAGAGAYGQWTTIRGGGPSTRSYIVPGLTNGTRYFFRVRAVNSDGAGPPSTEESATPSLTVDTTLRALSLSTVALAPVTLAPAFTPATRIYTAAVGSSVTQVTVTATPNKAGATATITPADANTTVAGHQVALVVGLNPIRARVTDGTNAGDYTITVTRAGSVPAAPTGLTATAGEDGGGAVTLSWTAPTGGGAVSRYEYQQRAGTGAYGAWTRIPNSGASTTSYTVPGLTNGTAYTFRVRAVNGAGAGAASTEATATPTARLVWAKSEQEVAAVIAAAMAAGLGDDMTFDAGEQIEILGSALFNAAPGVTLSYTAVSSNSDVGSAGIIDTVTVTVMAKAGGMADITITAMASLPSGLTINPQTDPREASITFPVEVDIEALVLELVGPTDMNLVEGGSDHANGTAGRATVTVQANRPVTREVTVTLLADRAMGDATAADFEADPIVIAAGATTGSTEVTAVDDGTAEDREALVLFGMAADNAGEVQGEVTLYLWDAAVPALPIIAQLLLAAFLLWVSGRRYRLRR